VTKSARGIERTTCGSRGADMSAEEVLRETRRYGNHLGVEFGTVYRSAAIIDDGTTPPDVEDSFADYAPSATPGCRAPHTWLGGEKELLSTHDLTGAGFTVLTGPDGEAWRDATADAARHLQVPVAGYAIGGPGLTDHDNTFFNQYGIDSEGAVLIRPDGYVAWRSTTRPTGGAPLTTPSNRSGIATHDGKRKHRRRRGRHR